MRDAALDRLLRAAASAKAGENVADEPPFGFTTRVLAQWRSEKDEAGADVRSIHLLFRRVAMVALLVACFASAGAYWQLENNEDLVSPGAISYAIADGAIETGAFQ